MALEVKSLGSKRAPNTSNGRLPEILVLEDEGDTRTVIRESLTRAGMKVREATEVEVVLEEVRSRAPDLLVLNMTAPKLSVLELCRWIRSNERKQDLAILIVSGEVGSADKVLGLEVGADDYLTEPFTPDELAARVKALLRRSRPITERPLGAIYRHGRLRIDLATRQVFVDDEEHYLPLRQFELLAFFVRNPHRIFNRRQLVDLIWGKESAIAYRTVNVAIRRLRREIERNDSKPTLIVTVRDVGYRFDPDG